ncbi:MAG TPA: ribosome maturation factor RimM [Anaerolineales bacterium]|jgi:16S rRNA processing protein RimM
MPNSKAPVNAGIPGSPNPGEPVVYLVVGTLRRTHGVRGDLLLDVITDFPERLKPGTTIFLGDKKIPLKITRRRPHNDGLILGFEGLDNAERAAQYRAQTAYVLVEDRPPLPEGEYYHHQVLGLNVVDETGAALGIITEIIETGANDVYVVTSAGEPAREILIPAIKQVLLETNLETHTMRVHLLPGLVDGGEEAG